MSSINNTNLKNSTIKVADEITVKNEERTPRIGPVVNCHSQDSPNIVLDRDLFCGSTSSTSVPYAHPSHYQEVAETLCHEEDESETTTPSFCATDYGDYDNDYSRYASDCKDCAEWRVEEEAKTRVRKVGYSNHSKIVNSSYEPEFTQHFRDLVAGDIPPLRDQFPFKPPYWLTEHGTLEYYYQLIDDHRYHLYKFIPKDVAVQTNNIKCIFDPINYRYERCDDEFQPIKYRPLTPYPERTSDSVNHVRPEIRNNDDADDEVEVEEEQQYDSYLLYAAADTPSGREKDMTNFIKPTLQRIYRKASPNRVIGESNINTALRDLTFHRELLFSTFQNKAPISDRPIKAVHMYSWILEHFEDLDTMTPGLREFCGIADFKLNNRTSPNIDIVNLVKLIRKLQGTTIDHGAARRHSYQEQHAYIGGATGSENFDLLKWAAKIANTQNEPTLALETDSYWTDLHSEMETSCGGVFSVSEYLFIHNINSHAFAIRLLQKVLEWVQRQSTTVNATMYCTQVQIQRRDTVPTNNTTELRDAILSQLPDDSAQSQQALKEAIIELAKRSNACILCRYLGHNPKASVFQHSAQDCPLSKILGYHGENWEHSIQSGKAGVSMNRHLNRNKHTCTKQTTFKPPLQRPPNDRGRPRRVANERLHGRVQQNLAHFTTRLLPQCDNGPISISTHEGTTHASPHVSSRPYAVAAIARPSVDEEYLEKAQGIAWLMDTVCEVIAGATSHRQFLVNIRPAAATISFGGIFHESTEQGDIPLGNNEFVRGVYILPQLSPFVNILNPTKIILTKKRDLIWRRDRRELITTAGTKKFPYQFRVITKSTLSYIVLPVLRDPRFNLHSLRQQMTHPSTDEVCNTSNI